MNKRLTKILFIIFSFICFIMLSLPFESHAYNELDYIQEYTIKVDPRNDGTLDIRMTLNWKVLNSSSEGPLEWVKIGVPNCYVNSFKSYSDAIDNIKYYSNSGSFIRIDFTRPYFQGENVLIDFSFHLSRMYHLEKDACFYHYNPGWFDSIRIGKMKVMWKYDNVSTANTTMVVDNYLIWERSNLSAGDQLEIKVSYNQSSFIGLSKNQQYSSRYLTTMQIIIIIVSIVVIVGIIVLFIIIINKTSDPYMSNRGFCGSYYWYYHPFLRRKYIKNASVDHLGRRIINPSINSTFHGSSSGGRSHSCACACACACAGGGRAGCSRKDFYNTNISTAEVIKNLK